MLIAVIGAFYLKEFPEAAVLVVLYVLGERLEDIGIENSKSALDELISKAPKTAFVKSKNELIPIDKISVGTIIQVKPGEMIPLDGKIISGETTVDEAAITGEPIPKDKHKGDLLFAGTLNQSGFIEIETTKLSVDTTFSKIIRLTFEAQDNKSETQKFIQKFSKYYTPAMILLSVLLFVVPVFVLGNCLYSFFCLSVRNPLIGKNFFCKFLPLVCFFYISAPKFFLNALFKKKLGYLFFYICILIQHQYDFWAFFLLFLVVLFLS